MESDKLSTDRAKARRSKGELQGTREHEEGDTSPVKGVASTTGSPHVHLGRQGHDRDAEARRGVRSFLNDTEIRQELPY